MIARRAVTLILVFMACCTPSAADRDLSVGEYPGMVLREVGMWPVSDPSVFVAAVLTADGSVVAGTSDGNLMLFRLGVPEHEVVQVGAPVSVIGRAPEPDGQGIVVVSQLDGALLQVSSSGLVQPTGSHCSDLLGAVASLPLNDGFIAIHSESEYSHHLSTFSTLKPDCVRSESVPIPCEQLNPTVALLDSISMVLGCNDPRTPLHRVKLGKGRLRVAPIEGSAPPDSVAFSFEATSRSVAMPLLQTDRGFLRVVSDLRRDARRFDLWNEHGHYVRGTHVNTHIGFVSSLPDHRLLLGMRNDNGFQLVVYEWSWAADGHAPQ
jgi:hypothetical protein